MELIRLTIDVFMPALPFIAKAFFVEEDTAQFLISAKLIGIATFGIVYGVLGDLYGRRPLIIIGLVIFTFSTILIVFAGSIKLVILLRFLQGGGEAGFLVLGMASLRDLYSGATFSKVIARMDMLLSISSITFPIMGGLIVSYGGWRISFIFLSLVSTTLLIFFYSFFKETLINKGKNTLREKNIIKYYTPLFNNITFLLFSFIILLEYIWGWSFGFTTTFLYIKVMGMPVKYYGFYTAISATAYLIGNFLNQLYVEKLGPNKLLAFGLAISILSPILLLTFHFTITLTPITTELALSPACLGQAIILNNALMFALKTVPRGFIGRSLGILKFLELIVSSITVYFMGIFYNGTVIPFSIVILSSNVLAILIFASSLFIAKNRKEQYKL